MALAWCMISPQCHGSVVFGHLGGGWVGPFVPVKPRMVVFRPRRTLSISRVLSGGTPRNISGWLPTANRSCHKVLVSLLQNARARESYLPCQLSSRFCKPNFSNGTFERRKNVIQPGAFWTGPSNLAASSKTTMNSSTVSDPLGPSTFSSLSDIEVQILQFVSGK